jgi:DUF1707 SHOCT-like domain
MYGPRAPQGLQVWTWPIAMRPDLDRPTVSAVPVRIGDAERDRAVSDLGDHFAAGRLTREEFDARVDQAMAARFDSDLQPLFVDLPRTQPLPSRPPGPPTLGLRTPWPLLFWWLPVLLVSAVVVAVLFNAPWFIWAFCWVLLMSGFWRGPRRHYRHYR